MFPFAKTAFSVSELSSDSVGPGVAPKHRGAEGVEHHVRLDLAFTLACGEVCQESLTWDISNPDNCPTDFAKMFLSEIPNALPEDVPKLALEISRQLENHCTRLALAFKKNVETLITEDVDESLVEADSDSEGSLAFTELPFSN